MANPSPPPPVERVRDGSARKKRSKMSSRASTATPGPWSRTVTPTSPSAAHVQTATSPPAGLNWIAFSTRLRSAWPMRSGGRGAERVGVPARHRRRAVERQRHAVRASERIERRDRTRDDVMQVERLAEQLEPALVDTGEHEQVVDRARHPVDLLARASEDPARGGRQLVGTQADVDLRAR